MEHGKKIEKIFLVSDNRSFFEGILAQRVKEDDFGYFFIKKKFLKAIKKDKKESLIEFLNSASRFLRELDYLIFALNKDLLYSFSFKSTYLRKSPQISLPSQELENILQKTQQKIFDLWQKEAKNFLKVKSIDLKVCNSECRKVLVNDHLVVNPLGFKAKSISFLLENTLIDKNLFYLLKRIFERLFRVNPNLSIKFIEKDFCFLSSLEEIIKEDFLYFGSWKDSLEMARLGEEIFEKSLLRIDWSFFKKAVKRISEAFEIEEEIAKKIYFLYFEKNLSLRFQKKLTQILMPIFLGLKDTAKFLFSQLKLKNKNLRKILILGDDLFWERSKKLNLNECFNLKKPFKKITLEEKDCLLKLKIKVKLNKNQNLERKDFLNFIFLNYPFLEKNKIINKILSQIIFRI